MKVIADVHNEGLFMGGLWLEHLGVDADDAIKLLVLSYKRGCVVGWESPEMSEMMKSGQKVSNRPGLKSELYQLGMVLWALATEEDEPELSPRPLKIADEILHYYRSMVAICLSARPRDRMWASELLRMFPAYLENRSNNTLVRRN